LSFSKVTSANDRIMIVLTICLTYHHSRSSN